MASCNQSSRSSYEVIDLVNHKQLQEEFILLSDVSEFINIIPLETSDSVLIGSIDKIKLYTNKLYITASNGVFVFDSDGKFLNTVGMKGRGPKEFINLYGIFPENDIVWIIDRSGKKVLKYSNTGIFLESFDLANQRFQDYYYSENSVFIGFIPDHGQTNTDIMLAFFDATGIVDSLLHRNPMGESEMMWAVYPEATFVNHGTQIKMKHLFNDTIYNIMNNQLYPDIVLNLGDRKANEYARTGAVNKDPRTHNITEGMDRAYLYGENDQFVYLEVENSPLFYDKKEKKVHKWTFILPDDERLDSEQAKRFIPDYIDANGNLIGKTDPANEENNPVIIIAKLK